MIADAAAERPAAMARLLPDARMIIDLLAGRPATDPSSPPPSPLYLRAPDAVPARHLLNL